MWLSDSSRTGCLGHLQLQISPNSVSITSGTDLHSPRYEWKVKRVSVHPGYSFADFTSPDLAIFELNETIPKSDGWLEKICLPLTFNESPGQVAFVAGWGDSGTI